MGSVYISRTNQKLTFARLHLDQLKGAQESIGWNKHALIESFNESLLFHLDSGYLSFLREIAEIYRLKPETVSCLADLQVRLEEKGLEAPEVNEIGQLLGEDRWLGQMQAAYAACWQAQDSEQAKSSHHASVSEIHVVQVNPDYADEQSVIAQLELWLENFSALVERQREAMCEW